MHRLRDDTTRQAKQPLETDAAAPTIAERARRRMLQWKNPVEYINNLYGAHPDENENEDGDEYFDFVFSDEADR